MLDSFIKRSTFAYARLFTGMFTYPLYLFLSEILSYNLGQDQCKLNHVSKGDWKDECLSLLLVFIHYRVLAVCLEVIAVQDSPLYLHTKIQESF